MLEGKTKKRLKITGNTKTWETATKTKKITRRQMSAGLLFKSVLSAGLHEKELILHAALMWEETAFKIV